MHPVWMDGQISITFIFYII